MLRTVSVILIVLALAGCDQKTASENSDTAAGAAVPAATAAITFQGVSYDLVGVGECGPRPDGTYSTWAFTLNADGEPLLQGPQIHALSDEDWSVIDFYAGNDDGIVRIYREGPDKLGFKDGVLEFEGALGAGLTEQARVMITCPE